jgi:hypothetical protein
LSFALFAGKSVEALIYGPFARFDSRYQQSYPQHLWMDFKAL